MILTAVALVLVAQLLSCALARVGSRARSLSDTIRIEDSEMEQGVLLLKR